jgi:hypothetical protein
MLNQWFDICGARCQLKVEGSTVGKQDRRQGRPVKDMAGLIGAYNTATPTSTATEICCMKIMN